MLCYCHTQVQLGNVSHEGPGEHQQQRKAPSMTRRRRIVIIAAIAATTLAVAGGTAGAVVLLAGDEQQPVKAAHTGGTAKGAGTSTLTPADDIGREACELLFDGGVLHMDDLTDSLSSGDATAVTGWIHNVRNVAEKAQHAYTPGVADAGSEIVDITTAGVGGNVGDLVVDLVEMPEPPVLVLATACMDADLVDQQRIDGWADALSE